MKWNTSNYISEFINWDPGFVVSISGRVLSFRRQGGIAFGHIQDQTGKIQFCFQKKILGEDLFKEWTSQVKIGVHVGLCGSTWRSSTGEPTILVGAYIAFNPNSSEEIPGPFVSSWDNSEDHWSEVTNFGFGGFGGTRAGPHPKAGTKYCFRLLQDVWRGFPDKINGIAEEEAKLRLRYLDCAINQDQRNLIQGRFALISSLRRTLEDQGFLEVETPVLASQASGAMATPFVTHHNALNSEMYLRIAPETYLKRAVGAGLGKVFEVGKQFRNEGIDPSHLQEFTSVEWYWPNADYLDNLRLFRYVLQALGGRIPLDWQKTMYTWAQAPEMSYRAVFEQHTGVSPDTLTCQEADDLFKRQVRPNLKEPVFILDYPSHMSPMAARKPGDDSTAEQWQFIVDGWEVVKCYTELTNPVIQRQLLEAQQAEKNQGKNDEAMALEEDFLEAMEYGMPPMSGLGIGIDRLVCLLAGCDNLKDTVLFPMMLARQ